MKESGKGLHPTKLLKQAAIMLMRTLAISCGLEGNNVQESATRILSSLLREIILVSFLILSCASTILLNHILKLYPEVNSWYHLHENCDYSLYL